MKIVGNTEDKLTLEDRPNFMSTCLWLMGAILLAAAYDIFDQSTGTALLVGSMGAVTLVIAWYFFPFQRIIFDQKSGQMHRRIARVTSAREEILPLTQIKSAAGQGNWSDGMRMERIVLLTNDAPYPLEFAYLGASRKPQIDAINHWLPQRRR